MFTIIPRQLRFIQTLLGLLDTCILSNHINALVVVAVDGSASCRPLTDITVIPSVLPLELPPIGLLRGALAVGAFSRQIQPYKIVGHLAQGLGPLPAVAALLYSRASRARLRVVLGGGAASASDSFKSRGGGCVNAACKLRRALGRRVVLRGRSRRRLGRRRRAPGRGALGAGQLAAFFTAVVPPPAAAGGGGASGARRRRPGGPAMTETSCSLSDDDDEPPSRARRATGRRAGLAPGRRIDGSLGPPGRIDGKARRGGLSGTQRWASGDSGMTPRSIVPAVRSLLRALAACRQKPAARRFRAQSAASSAGRGVSGPRARCTSDCELYGIRPRAARLQPSGSKTLEKAPRLCQLFQLPAPLTGRPTRLNSSSSSTC